MRRADDIKPDEMLIKKSKGGEIDLVVIVADGMLNGLAANCPVCKNASMVTCHGRVRCWGFMNGTTKCQYKCGNKDIERFGFQLPAKQVSKDWCQEWMAKVDQHMVQVAGGEAPPKKASKNKRNPPDSADGPPEVKKMKVSELRAELKEKGLDVSGKKAELAARLEEAREAEQPAAQAAAGPKRKAAAAASPLLPNQKQKIKKKSDGGGAAAARKPKPKREKPMAGSPILEVHPAYKQYPYNDYEDAKVIVEKGTEVYNAMLTDVNLAKGLNRYYVLQALEVAGRFQFFRHEGKVGQEVEESVTWAPWSYHSWDSMDRENYKVYPQSSKHEAVALFKKWFEKKTGNDWDERHDFRKKPNHYSFVELSTVNKSQINAASAGTDTADCTLESGVQSLVELMFDEDTIIHSMEESGVNMEEMPLGAVTGEVVEKARGILKEIASHLETNPEAAKGKGAAARAKTETAKQVWDSKVDLHTETFYHAIPTVNAIRIDNQELLQEKVDLINMLSDIALTQKLLKKKKRKKGAAAAAAEPHPLDEKYTSLGCGLTRLDKKSEMWQHIDTCESSKALPQPLSSPRLTVAANRLQRLDQRQVRRSRPIRWRDERLLQAPRQQGQDRRDILHGPRRRDCGVRGAQRERQPHAAVARHEHRGRRGDLLVRDADHAQLRRPRRPGYLPREPIRQVRPLRPAGAGRHGHHVSCRGGDGHGQLHHAG